MENMEESGELKNYKQKLFVAEYVLDYHGTNAAIRSGYNEKTAYSIASELLKKPEIQREIEKRVREKTKRTEVTVDRVINEIAKLAFFNAKKLFHDDGKPKGIHELDDDTSGAIAGIDVVTVGNAEYGVGQIVKYKIADKNKSLDQLCKHFGLNAPIKQEITGKDGDPLNPPELIIAINGKPQ